MIELDALPRASRKRIAIRVTPAAERALRAGHPWVFDRAIRSQSHAGKPGDLAVIFDANRRFLAIGLYDPHSPLRVRVLQWREPATIDRAWFAARLRAAAELRRPLLLALDTPSGRGGTTDGYRLVHGENDGLPGLVVDRYGGLRLPDATLVVKLYTAAWLPYLADVLAGLQSIPADATPAAAVARDADSEFPAAAAPAWQDEMPDAGDVLPVERIVLRYSRKLDALLAPYGLADGMVLAGAALVGPVGFRENGLRFAADVAHGHKTGFFFDQRDNRAQAGLLAKGRRVLDLFAYSGGFSVYAAAGGASAVTSIDSSGPALEAAAVNFALNRDAIDVRVKHTLIAADVFDALEAFTEAGQTFDMVIVDPPAFAKSAAEVERALAAYARLARLASGVLTPGGIFVMASCSSRVGADAFFNSITRAAQEAGHPLREIRRSGHALDHPITFPEGAYLKCLFARVAG